MVEEGHRTLPDKHLNHKFHAVQFHAVVNNVDESHLFFWAGALFSRSIQVRTVFNTKHMLEDLRPLDKYQSLVPVSIVV